MDAMLDWKTHTRTVNGLWATDVWRPLGASLPQDTEEAVAALLMAVACRGPSTRPIDGAMGVACGDRIAKAILTGPCSTVAGLLDILLLASFPTPTELALFAILVLEASFVLRAVTDTIVCHRAKNPPFAVATAACRTGPTRPIGSLC